MTAGRRDDGGVPRLQQRLVVRPGSASREEDWRGANEAKAEKLLRNSLQRRARARGLELRHSAYGYALIDAGRKHIGDRSDMTLDDVQSWLERG
jgi:hypothetical protein